MAYNGGLDMIVEHGGREEEQGSVGLNQGGKEEQCFSKTRCRAFFCSCREAGRPVSFLIGGSRHVEPVGTFIGPWLGKVAKLYLMLKNGAHRCNWLILRVGSFIDWLRNITLR